MFGTDRQLEPRLHHTISPAWSVREHLVCSVETGVVAAVEVSGPYAHDSFFLPGLLQTTTEYFPRVEEVSAGRSYLSRRNFEAAAKVGIDLFIPFRPTSLPGGYGWRPESRAWDRALHLYRHYHEEFMRHYRPCAVEDAKDAIEDRTGTCVHAKTEAGRFKEVLLKVLAHNACVAARIAQETNRLPSEIAGTLKLFDACCFAADLIGTNGG